MLLNGCYRRTQGPAPCRGTQCCRGALAMVGMASLSSRAAGEDEKCVAGTRMESRSAVGSRSLWALACWRVAGKLRE